MYWPNFWNVKIIETGWEIVLEMIEREFYSSVEWRPSEKLNIYRKKNYLQLSNK